MKKLIAFFIMFVFCVPICFAKNAQYYSLNYGGNKYFLLFSTKNKEYGGYLNEYYRGGETYRNWSDMVAVHHFPNAYSPIDQIKAFREYLGSINCPSALTFDDKNNVAMIDFVLIHQIKDATILEFNIFKYQKSKKCGSVALQYAKRYMATNAMQVDMIKKDFEKQRKKSIRNVKGYDIPAIIYEEIDICKLPDDMTENSQITEEPKEDDSVQSELTGGENIQEPELAKETIKDDKKEAADAETKAANAEKVTVSTADSNSEDNTKQLSSGSDVKEFEYLIQRNGVENELITEYRSYSTSVKDNLPPNNIATYENLIQINGVENESITEYRRYPESGKIKQTVNDVKYAPVPVNSANTTNNVKVNNIEKNTKPSNIKESARAKEPIKVKEQKKKNEYYTVTNSKDEFYAKPLTKKELKARNKKIKYERSLKAKKERVKNAEKLLNE